MTTKALLRALVLVLIGIPAAQAQELRLGVLPRLAATEITTMFTPLADYLGRKTGRKVTLVVARDFEAFQKQVRAGELDLAFSNPLIYVELKREMDLVPLGLAAEKKGGTRFRGILIVRKDSGMNGLQDVKGKRIIFVDRESLGGYLSQALFLKKHGIDLQRDFTTLPFAKKHDNVTMAVLNRAADVGAIREDDLEKLAGRVDLSQLKILAYTDYFPNWPLFANARVDARTRDAIRSALLALRPGDSVLESAKLAGFAPVADKDYDGLREAARILDAF